LKYRYKKKPYKHQVKALKRLLKSGWGGALLMQARTGKTKVVCDYASILHMAGEVNRVLVVCPVGVMDVWLEQIEENVPDDIDWRVTIWDKKGRKREPLPRVGQDCLDFVIVNYDAFSTPGKARKVKVVDPETGAESFVTKRSKKKGGKYDIRNALKAWQPQLMVLDESHRIKSSGAAKTMSIRLVAWRRTQHGFDYDNPLVPYRVVMTGTPWTKKKRPFDIYSQWLFLNPKRFIGKYPTIDDFKHEFGRFIQKEKYEQFVRPKNEERLKRLVYRDAYAVTREECYDLPQRLPDQIIHVEMDDSTAEAYDQMAQDMVARIKTGEISEASIALVQTLRLQQITSGLFKTTLGMGEPGPLVRISDEKLQTLKDQLEDLFEQDEKVIVGARYRADISGIVSVGQKFKVPTFQIHGGIKKPDRWKQIQKFKKTKGAALYVAQPAASSEGIDLRESSTTIWYSLTSSWVHWDQFNDRSALSERAQQMVYYIAGPVDQVLYDTLQEDNDVGKWILKNPEALLRT
jgi:hypothetical protein